MKLPNLKVLISGGFAKNVLMLSGATALSQVVGIAVLPVLTRIFSPEHFADLSLYLAFVGILAPVACLRFDLALSTATDKTVSLRLLLIALMACAMMGALCFAVYYLLQDNLGSLGRVGEFVLSNPWLCIAGILLTGFSSAFQGWFGLSKQFSMLSSVRLGQSVLGLLFQVAWGAVKASSSGLIIGHMIMTSAGLVKYLYAIVTQEAGQLREVLSAHELRKTVREYWRFPVFSVPEALFNAAGWHLPFLILANVLDQNEIGQLGLATRIVGIPMSLIGVAVSQVYFAEAAQQHSAGRLMEFTNSTIRKLVIVGGPLLLAGCLLAPLLFPFVFGEKWELAGYLALYCAPYYLGQLVVSPVTGAFHVVGALRQSMLLQLAGLAFKCLLVIFAAKYSDTAAIAAYIASGAAFYLAVYIFLKNELKERCRNS